MEDSTSYCFAMRSHDSSEASTAGEPRKSFDILQTAARHLSEEAIPRAGHWHQYGPAVHICRQIMPGWLWAGGNQGSREGRVQSCVNKKDRIHREMGCYPRTYIYSVWSCLGDDLQFFWGVIHWHAWFHAVLVWMETFPTESVYWSCHQWCCFRSL